MAPPLDVAGALRPERIAMDDNFGYATDSSNDKVHKFTISDAAPGCDSFLSLHVDNYPLAVDAVEWARAEIVGDFQVVWSVTDLEEGVKVSFDDPAKWGADPKRPHKINSIEGEGVEGAELRRMSGW